MPNCSLCGVEISEEQYNEVGLCSVCYLTKVKPKYNKKRFKEFPSFGIISLILNGIAGIIIAINWNILPNIYIAIPFTIIAMILGYATLKYDLETKFYVAGLGLGIGIILFLMSAWTIIILTFFLISGGLSG